MSDTPIKLDLSNHKSKRPEDCNPHCWVMLAYENRNGRCYFNVVRCHFCDIAHPDLVGVDVTKER